MTALEIEVIQLRELVKQAQGAAFDLAADTVYQAARNDDLCGDTASQLADAVRELKQTA